MVNFQRYLLERKAFVLLVCSLNSKFLGAGLCDSTSWSLMRIIPCVVSLSQVDAQILSPRFWVCEHGTQYFGPFGRASTFLPAAWVSRLHVIKIAGVFVFGALREERTLPQSDPLVLVF